MLKDMLYLFRSKKCKDIVVTAKAVSLLSMVSEEAKKGFLVSVIKDARSATFYSMGRVNVTKIPVLLITSSEELPSTLAGITEAYYQNLPLIIFSVGECYADLNEPCFKHVTHKILNVKNIDANTIKEIEWYFEEQWFKPLLIQIRDAYIPDDVENKVYEDVVKCIVKLCPEHSQIFIENDCNAAFKEFARQKMIDINTRKSTYGVLSVFLGHATVNENVQYLITAYDNIVRDINAFNMRQIKNNVVVIYTKPKNIAQRFDSWFACNKFEFFSIEKISELHDIFNRQIQTPIVIEYLIEER